MTGMTAPERQLVTVETIRDISPIEGADAIEKATVRGWNVVVKRGEFSPGDRVLYFEIDSMLPLADERFAFLAPRGSRELPDGSGPAHRLKTARLRGVYSQGLVLPIEQFADEVNSDDLAGALGVVKFEPPLPTGMKVAGAFPTHLVRKTDSERVQNLVDSWGEIVAAGPWTPTEKIDGTSLTVLRDETGIRVCSRNWEIAEPELRSEADIYWLAVQMSGLSNMIRPGEVVQAEIAGPGIQGNPLGLNHMQVFVFHHGNFMSGEPVTLVNALTFNEVFRPAPVLDLEFPTTPEEAVEQVDGLKSVITPGRLAEGVVWHAPAGVSALGGRSTFKAINNKFLAKAKD